MKHTMIEQIELGTYNFLWWKRSNPDRLDICSVHYPKCCELRLTRLNEIFYYETKRFG